MKALKPRAYILRFMVFTFHRECEHGIYSLPPILQGTCSLPAMNFDKLPRKTVNINSSDFGMQSKA